jgi:acyl-CoA thioesterase-2
MAKPELKDLLAVEQLDADLYRGAGTPDMPGRVYGGQAVAQALAAAVAGIEDDKIVHSLHAYFLRAGDNTRPIIFRVSRDFEGGSFANRRVVALQNGKAILNLAASFQRHEEGLSYAAPMPDLPGPEEAVPMNALIGEHGVKFPAHIVEVLQALDIRAGRPHPLEPARKPSQHAWFRLDAALDPSLARVALAFASDFALVSTAILPHRISFFAPEVQGASLDHAIWFHQDPPLGEWLLYAMESPWSGQGRGFTQGSVYDRSGRLIGSMTQEGLMRYRPRT